MDKPKLSIRDILPGAEEHIRVPIRARGSSDNEAIGYAVFRPLDPKTLRKYRTIYSGGASAKRTNPVAANAYLIGEKFVRFEGIDTEYQKAGFDSETAWFADSEDGQLLGEFVLGKYIVEATPDTDEVKE